LDYTNQNPLQVVKKIKQWAEDILTNACTFFARQQGIYEYLFVRVRRMMSSSHEVFPRELSPMGEQDQVENLK
jgi:hypothetical protein